MNSRMKNVMALAALSTLPSRAESRIAFTAMTGR